MTTHSAVTTLFTGDPKTDPVLRKVHQAMGLPGDQPILHATHSVVVNCCCSAAFVLCPPNAHHKLCNQRTDSDQCSVHLTSRYISYMDSIDRKSMLQSLMMLAMPQKIFIVSIRRSSPLFTVWKNLHSLRSLSSHRMQQQGGCRTATLCLRISGLPLSQST